MNARRCSAFCRWDRSNSSELSRDHPVYRLVEGNSFNTMRRIYE
jgi:hypothetical protein